MAIRPFLLTAIAHAAIVASSSSGYVNAGYVNPGYVN